MNEMSALQEAENLNTDQAIAWLKSQGIHTSRSGLDQARKSGKLTWLKVSGKARILYRREHLAAAFFEGFQTCPSNSSAEMVRETITSEAMLPDQIFTQALAQATTKRRKTSGSGQRRKSSNVHRLADARQ
ncbi:hypothetical protein [Pseudosulfitobacter pseudonitzschiae]|uniref:hypothetical protein n=1 Tax=Pseudosulfitobacter pseudonitzschiae TaxID=1402135 RepID=UPI001CD3D9B7|nr:hypothetical protein [Pseudosulfitobacter pseudonitzschiae]